MAKAIRCRDWCFTSYHIDKAECIQDIECEYMIFQHEICPTTGRKHLQGFLRFKNPRTFGGVQKVFKCALNTGDTHISYRRGTPDQALDYCLKEDTKDPDFPDAFEKGERPVQGKRTDLDNIKKRLDDQEPLASIIRDIPANYQAIKFAETYHKYAKVKKEAKEVSIFWYYGGTGTGKTRKAFEETGEDVWISSGKLEYWNGYWGQEEIILDDFRGNHCTLEYLLRVLDRYPFYSNVKNGWFPLRAKKIIITSCKHPEDIYMTNEHIGQLIRRINGGIFFFDENGVHRSQPGNTRPVEDVQVTTEDFTVVRVQEDSRL